MSAPPRSRNRLRRRYRGTYRRWLVAFENTWTGRGGRSLSLSLNHHILSGLLHRGSSISISTLLNGLLQRGSSISTTTPLNWPLYRGSSISITTLLNRLLHRGSSISITTPLTWPLYRGSSISTTTLLSGLLHRGSFYSAIDTGFLLGEMIVLNHIDQRLVDPDAAVVFDKAELAKAIHEEAYAGPGGADHLCQRLLRDLGNQRFRLARLAKLGHQQENSRQTLFTGVEKLVHQVGLGSHTPGQQIFQVHFGEGQLLVHHADHLFPGNSDC